MITKSIYLKRTYNFEIGASIISGLNMFGENIFGLRVNLFWVEAYVGMIYFPRY